MNVYLKEVSTALLVPAQISPAEQRDMPLMKAGWKFNWNQLFKTKGAMFYKLTLEVTPGIIEAMLMLSIVNGEMVYMNDIEVAPHNYGSNGKYDFAAGCMIAFACTQAFLKGKGNYAGYLTFESKTELIGLYQNKYGATWAMRNKMFIDPVAGKRLIEKYLQMGS